MSTAPLKPAGGLESLLGYSLRRAALAATAELEQMLRPTGIRQAQLALLQLLSERPGLSQNAAAQELGIQRPNMVGFIEILVRQGLIERRRRDGRTHALALTRSGRDKLARALVVVQRHESNLLSRVPKKWRSAALPIVQALWARAPATAGPVAGKPGRAPPRSTRGTLQPHQWRVHAARSEETGA